MSEPDGIILGRKLLAVIERDFAALPANERHVMLATALGISLGGSFFPSDPFMAIIAMGKILGAAAGYERQLKGTLMVCRGNA